MISRVLLADGLLKAGATAGPVLGLDTGTSSAYLGIVSGNRVLASLAHPAKSHGADLPELVEAVLGEAGLKFKDLAGIAVGIGPGSFTGLRVGVSYVKGLALASRIKVAGVPSLDAIALCAAEEAGRDEHSTICSVIDARKGEVYSSLYQIAGDALERRTDDQVVNLELLIKELEGRVIFAGEAKAEEACEHFRKIGGRGEVVGNARLQLIGGFIAAIGAARVVEGDIEPIMGLEPRYVRPPDAMVKHTALNRERQSMERREEELVQQYATHDEQLRAIYSKHLEYKHQLEAFRHKHYLNTEEEIEVKRIQKLKLATKDQIMEIVSRHQHADAR